MGILVERVKKAFTQLKRGNIEAFALQIANAGDVRYAFHFDIVCDEIKKQCKLYKKSIKHIKNARAYSSDYKMPLAEKIEDSSNKVKKVFKGEGRIFTIYKDGGMDILNLDKNILVYLTKKEVKLLKKEI